MNPEYQMSKSDYQHISKAMSEIEALCREHNTDECECSDPDNTCPIKKTLKGHRRDENGKDIFEYASCPLCVFEFLLAMNRTHDIEQRQLILEY